MGLDAVVYVNWDSIPDQYRKFLNRDPTTGEAYLDSDTTVRVDYQLKAVHARLGNMSAIYFLRNEISQLTNASSFITERVLFDGTHAGDVIALNEIDTLGDEIAALRTIQTITAELDFFLSQLEQLVKTAKSEQNPIVFT